MLNSKLIAFIAGTSIGALSAITGLFITAKMFTNTLEDEENTADEERAFFITMVHDYLQKNENENAEEYISTIDEVCSNFSADYRKFLVTLYDFVIRDDYDKLVEYIKSIQNIIDGYKCVGWMDTNRAIKSIINGETPNEDM